MEEMVTLTRYDLWYYGLISGVLAFVYYELAQVFVFKLNSWLEKRKQRRKEEEEKNK